jgi:hypothetical protein
MMLKHQFKDTKGQLWTLNVNIGHYMALKNQLGIDISESFDTESNWMAKLASYENLPLLLEVIDILTAGERSSREITLDQMYEGIDGDVVADATEALIEAVVLFLPAHKQKALRLIVDSVKVGMDRALIKMESEAQKAMKALPAQMDAKLEEMMKETTD